MARKVFGATLKNAMGQGSSIEDDAPATWTSPTVARAQASVLEEDKHATRLLDPNLIQMSAVMDRLDPSVGLEELIETIQADGQKSAILVRKVRGGLEIVFGRRRLLACRALGRKVRAVVAEMTDEEALIAQGVENNARKDPSFIERALFVSGIIRELSKTEESRKNAQTVAYRALQIDESLVSRMNRIATSIPLDLIKAIGPAHGSGRRAWERLSKLCEANPGLAASIIAGIPQDRSSAERLEVAIELLAPRKEPSPAASGEKQVRVIRKGNRLTLEADPLILPRLEEAIRRMIDEFLDRGQEDDLEAPVQEDGS